MSEYLSYAQNRYFILCYGRSYSTSSLQTANMGPDLWLQNGILVTSFPVKTQNHATYE